MGENLIMKKGRGKARSIERCLLVRKLAIFLLIFAVIFTGIPFCVGELDVHAASYWRNLSAKATGKTTVSVKWKALSKKQRKKISGIAVFRDGRRVSVLSKTSTSFKDKNLRTGTTYKYQLKTYKVKKQKQWFNKKTGVWQKKKPAKKYRGKSRKAKVYKYSNASPVRRAKTRSPITANSTTDDSNTSSGSENNTGGNSDGTPSTPSQSTSFITEDETTYVDFRGVRIHLGQKWTDSLNSQLKGKSSGTWSCKRSKGYQGNRSQNIYLYNTNTYNPFLAVYVTEGQITGWNSNSDPLSYRKGQKLARGSSKASFPSDLGTGNSAAYGMYVNTDYTNCVMIAVGYARGYDSDSDATERTIGYHFINAARVGAGKSILKRCKYLEGVDPSTGKNLTWKGTMLDGCAGGGIYFKDQRYGAQAWAETMCASNKADHTGLPKGPLGMENCPVSGMSSSDWSNIGDGVRGNVARMACMEDTDKIITAINENVATGIGESCVYNYNGSGLHLKEIFGIGNTSVGVGVCNGYHCEQYSADPE